MTAKTIEWMALDDLELWKDNPNSGDLGSILTSISRFGYNETIVVWQGRVQGGNHRKKALHQLQQGGWIPGEKDRCAEIIDGRLSIRAIDVSHLETEQEANAFGLALNRTTRLGLDDDRLLVELLKDIQAVDGDLLVASGYDGDDVDLLLADLGMQDDPPDDPGAQIDRAEELRQKWQTERGQIWEIPSAAGEGVHRIMCGDSTDADDVGRLMDGVKAEVVWTDPPYGVSIGDKNKMLNAIAPSNRVEENLVNDNLDEHELFTMICDAFDQAIKHCTAGAAWYVAAPPGPLHVLFAQALKDRGIWRQTIQWVKNNATFSPLGVDYHWKAEPIFYGWLPNGAHRYYGGRAQTTVWEIDRPLKSPEHPTMKPIELVSRAIKNSSMSNQTALDLFLGSGTTIVACEQTGRVGYGMEIAPGYVAVCLERLAGLGLTPRLING
jgi:DNA modification methylase